MASYEAGWELYIPYETIALPFLNCSWAEPNFSCSDSLSMPHSTSPVPSSPTTKKIQKVYQCDHPGCHKVFTSTVGFKYHIRKGHLCETKKKDKQCPIEGCKRSFASYQGLNYHLQNHSKQDIAGQAGVTVISSSVYNAGNFLQAREVETCLAEL